WSCKPCSASLRDRVLSGSLRGRAWQMTRGPLLRGFSGPLHRCVAIRYASLSEIYLRACCAPRLFCRHVSDRPFGIDSLLDGRPCCVLGSDVRLVVNQLQIFGELMDEFFSRNRAMAAASR